MNKKFIVNSLDKMVENPIVELDYNLDYELLIATMLSAQSTDKRVNIITKELFKYSLEEINNLSIDEISNIIKSVGTYNKKSIFIKDIASRLLTDHKGRVPNDRVYLESLKGVGRKTASVVLANLYNEPNFAVDTHVKRVSNILFITNKKDVLSIEKDLNTFFKGEDYNKINNQLILFGRYICTAKKPKCSNCVFYKKCKKTLQ